MNTQEQTTKQHLIDQINQRVTDKILEKSNADLLIKLISNAESIDEAIAITGMGTIYKRTGFNFDHKAEKMTDDIHYFKKRDDLSFRTDKDKPLNKLIIGDNYYVLRNLLIEYQNKVDVIYIDPPYGSDSMGTFAQTNYDNSISRDNLLSMLYYRLILAKELLADDGVIFCSIDDRNQAYVKCLFDEVFGERNYLTTFDWMKTATPPSLSKIVRKKFEYVLCYKRKDIANTLNGGIVDGGDMPLLNDANNITSVVFPKDSLVLKINDGVYTMGQYDRVFLEEDFIVKDGKASNDLHLKGHFKWIQNTINEEILQGTKFYIKSNHFAIRYQRLGTRIKIPSNIISKQECNVGTNEDGAKEFKSILGDNVVFAFPKPISLIGYLINMLQDKPSAIVLDFFAGSGTTGQAVLELNKSDNGNRQFILCQLDEKTDETPNNIAVDVTAERLKRVMTGEGYKGEKNFKWIENNTPFGGNLDVYEIKTISDFSQDNNGSAFDLIDETLYGKEKLSVEEKIRWVCENFSQTRNKINDEDNNE